MSPTKRAKKSANETTTRRSQTGATPAPANPLSEPMLAADDFYEALLDAHQGLSFEQSVALNARLVLVLAHQVGHIEPLLASIAAAKQA
jgi:hypothetical protein